MEWFRMYSEFATDPKVQMLTEVMQRRLVMLFCLQSGGASSLTDDDVVAFQLRISTQEAEETKAVLTRAGFIAEGWSLTRYMSNEPIRPLSHVWREIRTRIFKRDDYTCQYCGSRGKKLECDHVMPVSRGGSHTDDNLVTACFACNRSKRDKLVADWIGANHG